MLDGKLRYFWQFVLYINIYVYIDICWKMCGTYYLNVNLHLFLNTHIHVHPHPKKYFRIFLDAFFQGPFWILNQVSMCFYLWSQGWSITISWVSSNFWTMDSRFVVYPGVGGRSQGITPHVYPCKKSQNMVCHGWRLNEYDIMTYQVLDENSSSWLNYDILLVITGLVAKILAKICVFVCFFPFASKYLPSGKLT